MKTKKVLACLLLISLTAATVCSCGKGETKSTGAVQNKADLNYAEMTPEEICATLTLEQKAAQMI